MRLKLYATIALTVMIFFSSYTFATAEVKVELKSDPTAEMFINKCTGCHTIGKGKLTGPDLQTAIKWAHADLSKAIGLMRKNVGALTDDEVNALTLFLQSPDLNNRLSIEEKVQEEKRLAKLDPPSVALGSDLFHGKVRLKNGGPACVACHIVHGFGGTLGPDLTFAFNKMGQTGLLSACEKTQFLIMKGTYANHPVEIQEAIHLTAFFKDASTNPHQQSEHEQTENLKNLFGVSIVITLILVTLFISVFYRRRKLGVRQALLLKKK